MRIIKDQVKINISAGFWNLTFLVMSKISAIRANVKVVNRIARISGRRKIAVGSGL